MKKLLCLLMALLMIVVIPGSLAAEEDYVIENGVLKEYTGAGGDIAIPEGVVEIMDNVFAFKRVDSVAFPSTLKIIGSNAFFAIGGQMTEVTIPASVEEIGDGAFRGNGGGSLKMILVEAGNTHFQSLDGVLLSADGKKLLCYPVGKEEDSYSVPDGVETIKSLSFGNTPTRTIIFPASVTEIEYEAFLGSGALQELIFPLTVRKISSYAFGYCGNLSKVVIKNKNTVLVDDGFSGNGSLKIYAPNPSNAKTVAERYDIPFEEIPDEDADTPFIPSEGGEPEPIPVTEIILSKTKATLTLTADKKKPTLQLKVKSILPEDADDKSVEWTSSNPKVAKVDQKGKVTALKKGKAVITCTAKDGSGVCTTCTITVKNKLVSKITLNKTKATVKKGKTLQLKVKTIKPANAFNQKVKWTSSNKKVATVDKTGKVKALKKGTCTITCTAQDGSKVKAVVKITVK